MIHHTFWTLDEVARNRWHCHPMTIYRLIGEQKLRARCSVRGFRITEEELERYEREAST